MTKQACVVGSNAAGLATALRLRNLGYAVTVVEPDVSLRDHTFTRDGFVFDCRETMFTLPAVYRDLFLKTGNGLETAVELIPLETAIRFVLSDGTTIDMPGASPARMTHVVAQALGAQAGDEWKDFTDFAADEWEKQRTTWQLGDGSEPLTFKDSRLQELSDAFALLHHRIPTRTPKSFAAHIYMYLQFGAWHIAGGLGQLTRALYDRACERGVEFAFNTSTVDATSDFVVNALEIQQAQISEYSVHIAINGVSAELSHHNVWVDDDAILYLCRPEDDSMHPAGSEAWNARLIFRTSDSVSSENSAVEEILRRLESKNVVQPSQIMWTEVSTMKQPAIEFPPQLTVHRVGGNNSMGYGLAFDGMSADLLAQELRSQISE